MNHTFPVLHFQTTKEFCFMLLKKDQKLVLMLLRADASVSVCVILFALIRSEGADLY
jgi:hypothetical protein